MKKFTPYSKKHQISLKEAWTNHLRNSSHDKLIIKESTDATSERHLLSVDIGGSSLKICGVHASGNIRNIESGVELFSMKDVDLNNKCIWMWIVLCIKQYFAKHPKKYSEGCLTVSYPLKKEGLRYKIMKCGKDFPFNRDNFENADPLESINKMCSLNGIEIEFLGVMNDSIATTINSYFNNRNTVLGIVLGTGTNGSIIVKEDGKTVIFNSEWGSFDDKTVIRNEYDNEVIKEIKNEHYNLLDVMVGGYKMNDYLKKMTSVKLRKQIPDLKIKEVLKKKKNSLTKEEKTFLQQFVVFKKRSKKILAALAIASVIFSKNIDLMNEENKKEVHVCLNGSAFENEKDQKEFEKSVKELLVALKLKKKIKLVIDFMKDASLLGSTYFESIE